MENEIFLPYGQGHFYGGVFVDDWIYFSTYDLNGLFKKNLKTGEQYFVKRFDEYNSRMGLHENAFRINNDLFFLPLGHVEKKMSIYHMDRDTVDYIELPQSSAYTSGRFACTTIDYEDSVWIIPCFYDALLRIDKQTYEIKRYNNWPDEVNKHGIDGAKFYSAVLVEEKIYLCPYACPSIVVFDIRTEKMYTLPVDIEMQTYRKILSVNKMLYLFPENVKDDMLICDLFGENVRKCKIVTLQEEGIYHAITCVDNRFVWMLPYEGNYIVKYDIEGECAETVKIIMENQEQTGKLNLHFWDCYESDDKSLITMGKTTSPFLIIDKEGITGDKVVITSEMIMQCLIDFIEGIPKNQVQKNRDIGEMIYNTIKEV